MDSRKLLSHIVTKINMLSKFYFAETVKTPRLYFELIGGRISPFLRKGISIDRDVNASHLPMSAFIFEPEIVRYVTKMSHKDSEFSKRLHTLSLNSDDIEIMVKTLSYQKIKLYMKGRKIFETDYDD